MLNPGVLGPAYLKKIAALLPDGASDPAKMIDTMLRYGSRCPDPARDHRGEPG
jgi:hypothetical protein